MLRQAVLTHRLLKPSILRPIARNGRTYATASSASTATSRIARLESRLPRFLQRIVTPLRSAPISHITAFLLLHEITAVLPLLGLAAGFHYYNWLPPYFSEGKWVSEGTEKFGRYLRKKGWITEEKKSGRWWGRGEKGTRLVVELATAYAVTKALLPLRLVVSVWLTPWFARWTILPVTNRLGRLFSWRKGGQVAAKSSAAGVQAAAVSPAAGTNAVGAGVLPKAL